MHPSTRLTKQRVARNGILLGLRMFDVSIDGLNAIIFSCAILALAQPLLQKDNSGFIEWVSAKLLGEEDEDSIPSANKVEASEETKAEGETPRVRNPITGRWIAYEGMGSCMLFRISFLASD